MRCAACKRELSAGEAVYLVRVGYGGIWYQKFHNSIGTVCATCVKQFEWPPKCRWLAARPCQHCARPVFVDGQGKGQRYFVCGDECRVAIYNANARAKAKRWARPRIVPEKLCASCAQPFTPNRCDADYCSSKCRQAAYRQRIARAF